MVTRLKEPLKVFAFCSCLKVDDKQNAETYKIPFGGINVVRYKDGEKGLN